MPDTVYIALRELSGSAHTQVPPPDTVYTVVIDSPSLLDWFTFGVSFLTLVIAFTAVAVAWYGWRRQKEYEWIMKVDRELIEGIHALRLSYAEYVRDVQWVLQSSLNDVLSNRRVGVDRVRGHEEAANRIRIEHQSNAKSLRATAHMIRVAWKSPEHEERMRTILQLGAVTANYMDAALRVLRPATREVNGLARRNALTVFTSLRQIEGDLRTSLVALDDIERDATTNLDEMHGRTTGLRIRNIVVELLREAFARTPPLPTNPIASIVEATRVLLRRDRSE